MAVNDLFYNNFSQGIISPKMAGRTDLAIYHNGCADLVNFLPMIQGGFTRRPGTVSVLSLSDGFTRIIPFVLDVSRAYLVLLGPLMMRVVDADGNTVVGFDTDYTSSEIGEIQFTQDYETLYLAHRNHTPKMLTNVSGGLFEYGTLSALTMDDGNYPDKNVAFAGNDCPGGVAYRSNRLWFLSSLKHPFRMWASQPFEPTNFRCYDMVKVVDEAASSEAYAKAIKDGTDLPDSTYTDKQVISADNAMVLEVGSDRNDRMEWMGANTNLIVGTASGEWMMSGTIDALDQSIVQVSAYGSAPIQCVMANSEVLFIQSGGKRLRSYQYASAGSVCKDLTYQSDEILKAGVVCMAWQRVPEPRLYCVLKDGTMAVLCYDSLYGLCAWCRWTISGTILSICVLDNEEGQDVYALTLRDGVRRIERFTGSSYADLGSIVVHAQMRGNRLESGNTIGKPKRITKAIVRVLDSGRFDIGYNGDVRSYESISQGEAELYMPGGFDKDLALSLSSVGDDPLTVLAMSLETEVT